MILLLNPFQDLLREINGNSSPDVFAHLALNRNKSDVYQRCSEYLREHFTTEYNLLPSDYSSKQIVEYFMNEHTAASHKSVFSSGMRVVSMNKRSSLRDYQIDCVEQLVVNHRNKQNSLLILPTGAGKTRTALSTVLEIIQSTYDYTNVLWLAHTKPLCNQASGSMEDLWRTSNAEDSEVRHRDLRIMENYESNALPIEDELAMPQLVVSTYNSVEKIFDLKFDIIIADECHQRLEIQQELMRHFQESNFIGLTATPSLGGNLSTLSRLYSRIVFPRSISERHNETERVLIEQGILSEAVIEEKSILTLANSGSFRPQASWQRQPETIRIAYNLTKQMLDERQANQILIFVNGIERACILSSLLFASGIPAYAVHADTKNRESIFDKFRMGDVRVIVSVDILREGVDLPNVDGVLIMRQGLERNDPMVTQMIGRGLRGEATNGGTKQCKVILVKQDL